MNNFFAAYNKIFEKRIIKKLRFYVTRFIDSDVYIIFVMMLSLLNWKLKAIWPLLIIGSILFLLIMLLDINRMRLIPIGLFGFIALRLENVNGYVIPAIIGSLIIVPLLFFDLLRKRLLYKNKVFVGMILILITMGFSVVNAPNLITPLLGILMWIFYCILFLFIFNKKEEHDTLENNRLYLAKSMTFLGIAIFLEIVLFYLEFTKTQSMSDFFNGKYVQLGWAMTNYVAMIYLMIIPLSCYLLVKKQRHYFLLLVILIEIISLIMMLSRGAYLAILITSIPFIIKFMSDIKDKITFTKSIIVITILLLLLLIIIVIPTGIIKDFFHILNERGISLTGRELIYKRGFQVFSQYPLFGGGVYTSKYYISLVANSVYYHNYVVQTLATIGIIGMIAFLYYLYQLVKQAAINDDYNIYVFFIILNMLVHGLFDTTFYNPLVMFLFSIIIPLLKDKEVLKEHLMK